VAGCETSAHLHDLFDATKKTDFFLYDAAQVEKTLEIGAGTGRMVMSIARSGKVSSVLGHRRRCVDRSG
jgi:tRNA G46 methylase TrmB